MPRRTSHVIERGIRRVWLNGRWCFRVQLGSRGAGNRRSKVCATLEQAQATKAAWHAEASGTAQPPIAEPPLATVEDGLRHYAADLVSRRKDPARAAQVIPALARHDPDLLALPIGRVTVADLHRFVQRRQRARIKDNTIARDLRVLRAMLRKARPELAIPSEVFPIEDHTRVRVLQADHDAGGTDDVFPRLAEPFRTMARLAAITLMRQGDLRRLERDMVHLPQRIVLLPRSKTGPRPVVLNAEAIGLLDRQLASHTKDLVFPNPAGKVYSAVHVSRVWRKAARAAGLTGFTFHDLKHHGATVALNNGATDRVLMQLGGWKSPKMIGRYALALDPALRAASEGITRGLRA